MGLSETRVPQHHMVYNKLSLWKIAILRIYTPLSDTSIWILPPFFPPMASFGSGSVAQVGTQGHREFLHAIIQIAGGVSHPLPVTPWRQWLRQWLCLIQWVVYTNNGAIFIGEPGKQWWTKGFLGIPCFQTNQQTDWDVMWIDIKKWWESKHKVLEKILLEAIWLSRLYCTRREYSPDFWELNFCVGKLQDIFNAPQNLAKTNFHAII